MHHDPSILQQNEGVNEYNQAVKGFSTWKIKNKLNQNQNCQRVIKTKIQLSKWPIRFVVFCKFYRRVSLILDCCTLSHQGIGFLFGGQGCSLRVEKSREKPTSSLLQNICFDEDRYKRLILGKNPDEKGRMNILTNCVQIWIRFQNSFQDLQTFGHFKSDKTHPLSLTVDGKFHLDPPFSRKSIIQKHPNWHADTYPLQGTNISHFRELTYPTTAHSCFQLPLDGIF